MNLSEPEARGPEEHEPERSIVAVGDLRAGAAPDADTGRPAARQPRLHELPYGDLVGREGDLHAGRLLSLPGAAGRSAAAGRLSQYHRIPDLRRRRTDGAGLCAGAVVQP